MRSDEPKITCPKCGAEVLLTESLAAPLVQSARRELEQKLAAARGEIAADEARKAKAALGDELERRARALAELEAVVKERDGKLAAAQAAEVDARKRQRELDDARRELDLTVEKRVQAGLDATRERARAEAEERLGLKLAEREQTLAAMQRQIEELKRKAEQGSQQLQGEVLELLLQEELAAAFPIDSITEVKKGARGGDAVHTVKTRSEQVAGIILWEAKRAQRWSGLWPAKLKEDMRQAGAVAGVIVTTSFPSDWPERKLFGLYEGVWLTSAAAAIPMAAVLREGLLEAHKARVAVANKGEKMEAVYDYLTSPQFAHKLKAVYEVFGRLREELHAERTAMQQRWKRREKQIELATVQLVGIAGDLQGLAQQDLPQLELEPDALAAPDDEADADGDEQQR